MDFYEEITNELKSGRIRNKMELQKEKVKLSKKFNLDVVPSDVEILNYGDNKNEFRELLKKKPTRTISGVAVVAAMTSPEACPHGKCLFCPGGVDNNSPQSYTGFEPSALRGRNNYYDSYNITFNRLKQLENIGHDTSKVDLIVMGGTFTARTEEYQKNFVKGCLDGMNKKISNTLEESILENETASRRCIGLTIETKPDWFYEKEIDLALSYGTTKVELGVQILNDKILRDNLRGHGIEEIIRSTQLARDAGLKVLYHLMPGMYGADYKDDIKSFDLMMSSPDYMPDMLKIYPTLVVKNTSVYRLWREGKYTPYDTERAVQVISYFMKNMPPWVRVMRMQRDIPVHFIEAGVKRSDLHNLVNENLKSLGIRTMEIRSREVGITGEKFDGDYKLIRRNYIAAGGDEIFLSFENSRNEIIGYLRLRIPSEMAHRKEVLGSSIIREIKVLGDVVPIGSEIETNWQHHGFGQRLIREAERITLEEYDKKRILVISGIGVRNYFRKLGYERLGPYMAKSLNHN
ncbi:tRNA uridine(34) 5-carboxymethylaminomethyl modification radical SAM/GNAT enzyme Elp3 [Acidiplasma sp.]|uniref:tRNA uridine(34) 5-carboxymethylaminomethyl modification radical SAM/GNAT enzyme Elp3 n=1 Tax=Acidiplasma sp. TaxID=1872114 RepID=UPI00258B2351|nr:tRNA uridine(34) 5-carboxymethylaminomethyl modification radical SAM/GNAT enzyme Elp3 [Acidiplasma sp.]